MTKIRFGTDGWRALMSQDFTHANVALVIQAFCDVNPSALEKNVYVGYDRRKNSKAFAQTVAKVLAANGFTAYLSSDFCPTPCISWLTKESKALAGIMVTASHNPSDYNGIKFKESYGGSASPEYTQQIEDQIDLNQTQSKQPLLANFDEALSQKQIVYFNPADTYVRHLSTFVDIELIHNHNQRVAYDAMYGAGSGYLTQVLKRNITEWHGEEDPTFGGTPPEPIEKNLSLLKSELAQAKADVGLATDGDADRIGAIDETGRYITTHQIFALLLKHHVTHRKVKGTIVMSVSTTSLIRKMCAHYGLKLIETPVGFKHICKYLKSEDALMGGEESGGISFRDHVHERDGLFNGLMLLEMMALHKKSLGDLLKDLERDFGIYAYERIDYHLDAAKIERAKVIAQKMDIKEIAGVSVKEYQTLDGIKIFFEDDSWLLMRSSGTEPLMRTYAEAATPERVQKILDFAKHYLKFD